MSDYQYPQPGEITFGTRDGLAPGSPEKVVKGIQLDTEFNALVLANTSKLDSNAQPGSFTGVIDGGDIDGGTF